MQSLTSPLVDLLIANSHAGKRYALERLGFAADRIAVVHNGVDTDRFRPGDKSQARERLGIPKEVETVALLPIGYPVGRFGPTTRKPPEEVTYWDGWNQLRARR